MTCKQLPDTRLPRTGGLSAAPAAVRLRRPAQHALRPDTERGVILVWALLTAFLVAGIVLATTDEIRAVDKQASFEFSAKGQVEEVAQAGLTDAVAWFRGQSTQPVKAFNPKGLPPSLRPAYSLPPIAKLPPELSGLAGIDAQIKVNGAGNQVRITDPVTGKETQVHLKDGQAIVTSTNPDGTKTTETVAIAGEEGVKNYRVTTSKGKTTVSYELDGRTSVVEYDNSDMAGIPAGLARQLQSADYYSLETIDSETPELGLVRTYQLTPELWARYTVSRGMAMEDFSDRNGNGRYDLGEDFEDLNGDGHWSQGSHSRDVGRSRGVNGAGAIWYVTSKGEIFRRVRSDLGLGEGPNTRLAVSTWGTELRRLSIATPAAAALCVQDGGLLRVQDRVTIRGDTAIAYGQAGGDPVIDSAAKGKKKKKKKKGAADGSVIEGSVVSMPNFQTSYDDVFGVPWTRMMSMADIATSTPEKTLPARLPVDALIVITGDVTFDKQTPLSGSALVIVRGNCTIARGSNSFFTGLLYVDGDLELNGPAFLRGTTIVTGACTLRGSGSEAVELEHDAGVLTDLLARVGQYRFAKAPFRVRGKLDGPEEEVVTPAPEPPKPEKTKKTKKKSVKVKTAKKKK
jgi:hypothetical protein